MKKLTVVNTEYGYLEVDSHALLQHPRPVVRRVISAALKYVSGYPFVRHHTLNKVVAGLSKLEHTRNRVLQAQRCILFSLDHGRGRVGISRCTFHAVPKPVKVGKCMYWDNLWEITLESLASTADSSTKFFVRSIGGDIYLACVGGVRAVGRVPLPPVRVRGALPVILDEKGKVVSIPHLKYLERAYGVEVHVKFKPLLPMDIIISKTTNTTHH